MNDVAENGGHLAQFAELVDELIQGWRALAEPTPGDAEDRKGKAPSAFQRAYLLFNRLEGNTLAQELIEQFPKWARDRCTVPDSYFQHRSERAPFLLELPEELLTPPSGVRAKAVCGWLMHCLQFAATQVDERTTQQDFCGVVMSGESERTIASHWVDLGDQLPPGSQDSALFRYHDPRVMQRVWPTLSDSQQSRWMGPVTQWWSLAQPWGAINDAPEPAQWFRAEAPTLPSGTWTKASPRNLFDAAQWFVSGVSPDANSIWRSYADNNIPAQVQPDPQSMVQMLADARDMGLQELDLEDYVWITWMHAPKEGAARVMDWSQAHLIPILHRIQDQLRDQPDARFSTLFVNATRSQK
jgi:hypothetical protein